MKKPGFNGKEATLNPKELRRTLDRNGIGGTVLDTNVAQSIH